MADVPAGQTITANIYEANSGARGPLLATGSTVSTSAGSQWYDVPIAFTTAIGDQYDIEVTCILVNDFRYWDDTTGVPYSPYGIISVNDGVSGLLQRAADPRTGLDARIDELLAPDLRLDADGSRDGVREPPSSREIEARHGQEDHLWVLAFHRPNAGGAAK